MRDTEKHNRHRSCDGCLSLHNEGHKVCELGYPIEHRKRKGFTVIRDGAYISVPQEKCPKPTRYSHLITIQLNEEGRKRAEEAGVY
jgi:hypothetical protein